MNVLSGVLMISVNDCVCEGLPQSDLNLALALRNAAALPEQEHQPIHEWRNRSDFAWQRAFQFEARAALIMDFHWWLPVETCFLFGVGRECSSKHGRTALRLLFRRLILNDIPMLREFPGFDTHNIGGNPIHRSNEITKSPVHDHEVSLGHDRSRFVLQCWRDALDEIEQTLATRCDMSTMLNVVGRPKSFCGRIVALVEECVERFQDEGLVLFGCSLRHDDSFRA